MSACLKAGSARGRVSALPNRPALDSNGVDALIVGHGSQACGYPGAAALDQDRPLEP